MMRLWEIPRVEGLTKKKIMYSGDDEEDPMNDLYSRCYAFPLLQSNLPLETVDPKSGELGNLKWGVSL